VPARLLLLDDASATPTERWIERPFLTIGTDPGSDLLLAAGGEQVRIYLQFRDGRYEAFNKQAGELRLGGRPVPPGTSAAWEPGVELEAGGHRLRLVVEGDPAPGPRPLAAASRPARAPIREPARPGHATPTPAAGPEPGPPAERSQAVKLAVIFGCLAASTLLLFRDRILPPSAAVATDPEGVTALIMEGFAAQATEQQPATAKGTTAADEPDAAKAASAAELRRRLARRLQWAETAWRQEDYSLAAERYTALKRYLDASRLAPAAEDSPAADDWQTRLAIHVDARLADLARQ
jgi:hypothetical protein